MTKTLRLAPSILSADFAHLGDAIATIERAGAQVVHVDVMDGHFVPNLTIGAPVVRCLRPATELPLDCHLMISEPDRYVDDFIAAGADWITFHVEAVDDPRPILQRIRAAGRRCGLAIRPKTPVDALLPYVADMDLVVIMTVEPGFGGQKFMSEPLEKIAPLKQRAAELGIDLDIEVDGGIDLETLPTAIAAGVDVFVAGSAVYGTADVPATVERFLARMSEGAPTR